MNMYTVLDYLNKKNSLPDKLDMLFNTEFHDTYFSRQKCVEKLKEDYEEWGNLIVAFDFDDTVAKSAPNYDCSGVINLLRICSELQFIMICFTARANEKDLNEVKETLNRLGIKCDYINEDYWRVKEKWSIEMPHKVFYNIFLDDRAGLKESYEILRDFIKWFVNKDIKEVI